MCGILLLISATIAIIWRSQGGNRLPPSPLALPIIGHLHLLSPIPHQAFHKLSTKYGPLIYLLLGSVPCVLASTAETAKEFLKTHELSFSDRPFSAAVDYLTYGSADFSFAPYGPYWKFMKKICMSELLGGRTLDQLLPVRREEIRRLLMKMIRKSDSEDTVDVGGELITLANNIISRMMMNKRCSESEKEAEDVRSLVHEVAELTGTFNLSDYIWFCRNIDLQGLRKRFEDLHVRFDAMAEKIMKEHEEVRGEKNERGNEGDRVKDLLDILLDVAEDDKAELKLTRENIKAFILDIFAAGTDTTAITIEWALAELINQPDIFDKAREEIDSVVGKSRLVEESDIQNLPYLQAIVKETLRLHPTAPLIVRESTEDCKIGEYNIPKKTRLFVNVWAIGRDPKHWDNPLEFRPNRFLTEGSGKSQLDVRGQHFHLLPFGSGRRGCPATTLALQVVQTTLASMIQCFKFKLGDGKGTTVDMTEAPGLTLPRAHPLVCVPVARFNLLPLI
ncbi:hypothetical protein AQUCO_00900210v1 [Aquilegia coerulea]|uniref:Uncharacterized protein n=1 Tax=Aquilegia coerulea TaxID=218851 RepID=A0A2G5ECH5_AQUCA|nr:hypothetical protein AQUCO_00900210v1 [Aquilegia coerulea]